MYVSIMKKAILNVRMASLFQYR